MTLITSLSNPRVAQVRDLHTTRGRKKSGLLLMEGPHLLAALLSVDILPEEIYVQSELLQRTVEGRALLNQLLHSVPPLSAVPLIEVSEQVAAALSDAQTSQGVLCVVSAQQLQPQRLRDRRVSAARPALLVLDDLSDPGNLGTILRTALAADVEAVLLTPHCVDCYSPKVIRSAAGAHLALPIWIDLSWSDIKQRMASHTGEASERIFIAEASASQPYHAQDFTRPFALIVGNEAHGLSQEARLLTRQTVSIPLANQVESLNVAMATGIILFESVRQLQYT